MNSLSWLLYWADVAPSLADTVANLGVGILIIGFLTAVAGCLFAGGAFTSSFYGPDAREREADEIERHKTLGKGLFSKAWKISLLSAFLFLGSAFVPSNKNTYYAIAASEMGERVLNNPRIVGTTNKAMDALDSWLDKQLDPPKPAAAPVKAQ